VVGGVRLGIRCVDVGRKSRLTKGIVFCLCDYLCCSPKVAGCTKKAPAH